MTSIKLCKCCSFELFALFLRANVRKLHASPATRNGALSLGHSTLNKYSRSFASSAWRRQGAEELEKRPFIDDFKKSCMMAVMFVDFAFADEIK